MAENETNNEGPLKSGPLEITDEDLVLISLGQPERIGDLGLGMVAQIKSREGVGPALVIRALKQLTMDLEQQFGPNGGKCGCGRNHD